MPEDVVLDTKSINIAKSEQVVITQGPKTRVLANLTIEGGSTDNVKARFELQGKHSTQTWEEQEFTQTDRRNIRPGESIAIPLSSEEYSKLASFIENTKSSFTGIQITPGRYIYQDSSLEDLSKLLCEDFFVKVSMNKDLLLLLADVLSGAKTLDDVFMWCLSKKIAV